ncbi:MULTISPECIES: hypothetical protein [Streptomyces]|uniref:Mucin-2 n=1 Tax=Streptomyces chartreusis NRRL 3882 TaxID=1079985 RepID=A0A2N9B968_STRCX|nr:hypothetical protein [Streptomyces chartreusis]MYS95001.1 hypothetical protein [Streptomyces sp. SID5464]SOR79894.1 hypothetical protein SCNRRL3882_3353 [Streptomyces chartreusis NRRL 3882]
MTGKLSRVVNPQDLEQLAKLLDGRGGVGDKLSEAFTRASALGVSSKLTAIRPMHSWISDTAPELRKKAAYARLEDGDPLAGLLLAGFTPEQLKNKDLPPDVLLVANATASDGEVDDDWLKKKDGESLDDWLVRVQGDAVTQLTGNEKLGKAVATYIEGAANLSAFFTSSTTALLGGKSLISYFRSSKVLNAPGTFTARLINGHWDKLSRIPRAGSWLTRVPTSALAGSDEAAMLAGYMRKGAFYMPTSTEANLLRVAQRGGLANAAKAAGWIRGVGIVGSAGATAWGIANLATMDHGKAWKEDKAKYLSNWTGTAFNASLTAAMVAPNPVTVGLAVGTGLAYAGTLVWDNWDSISKGAEEAADWVGDKADKAGEAISDGAKKLGSALNPFD